MSLRRLIKWTMFVALSLANAAEARKISKIQFTGNNKTAEDVLHSVISLHVGEEDNPKNIANAVQELKNTTVFRDVTATTKPNDKGSGSVVTFNVVEKWTIIPYFQAGSGGGSSYLILGALDTNFLGRLYKATAQAGMINNKPAIGVGFENDYTGGTPLITSITAIYMQNYYKYYALNSADIAQYASFTSVQVNPLALWRFNDDLQVGGGFLYSATQDINSDLTQGDKNTNTAHHAPDPNSFSTVAAQGVVKLGVINYDDLSQDGVLLQSTTTSTGDLYKNSQKDYSQFDNVVTAFFRLPRHSNSYFAARVASGHQTSDNLLRQYRVGGLSSVRGFIDGQFVGKDQLYANAEYRATVWQGNYVAVQPAVFFDYGTTGQTFGQMFDHLPATSVGAGLRVPLIRVNGIVLRLDYAVATSPFKASGASMGIAQFF